MDVNDFIAGCTDIKKIAQGGQKEVFKGNHPDFGSIVIKRIQVGDSSLKIERLKREVRAVQLLRSISVPPIFFSNCDEKFLNEFFIIEKYIPGLTLRTMLDNSKIWSVAEVVSFIKQMLIILIETEKLNIIHRDIKPENIIFDSNGMYWLLDFGISRHLDLDTITADTPFGGPCTLGYAASEQFRNLKREIDSRTDLFSLGVVAYELLTGRNEYVLGVQSPLEILHKIESAPLPLLDIKGDSQFLLASFIHILGNNMRNRRPKNAAFALQMLEVIKPTLKLEN